MILTACFWAPVWDRSHLEGRVHCGGRRSVTPGLIFLGLIRSGACPPMTATGGNPHGDGPHCLRRLGLFRVGGDQKQTRPERTEPVQQNGVVHDGGAAAAGDAVFLLQRVGQSAYLGSNASVEGAAQRPVPVYYAADGRLLLHQPGSAHRCVFGHVYPADAGGRFLRLLCRRPENWDGGAYCCWRCAPACRGGM